jgi:inosine-uridine nucleoside N-ribohydrolase
LNTKLITLLAVVSCVALSPAADARDRVIVDADMSFDDAATLAYLAQADRHGFLDLEAVTVSLSGAGYTGRGLSHARCLLQKLGPRGVPVSDGDTLGANPLPEAIRSYVDRVVHNAARLGETTECPDVPTEGRAARLLAAKIRSSRRKVTLIALGPLTNVAQALRRRPSLARRIERVFIMGAGTTHGNLCCGAGDGTDHGQEFNFWADPAAAQEVFTALSGRIFLTALNATDHVPITFGYYDRIGADRKTEATETVHQILSDPDVQGFMRQGLMYWWDPLNAAASIVDGVVTYEPTRLSVVQDGVEAGRTVVDPRGALIRLGVTADARLFEDHFLDMLNGRLRCSGAAQDERDHDGDRDARDGVDGDRQGDAAEHMDRRLSTQRVDARGGDRGHDRKPHRVLPRIVRFCTLRASVLIRL